MIERFEARNYGCLRDVSIELTPLHAFIGPNDSGKSTILTAIRTLARIAAGGEGFSEPEMTRLTAERALLCAVGSSGSFCVESKQNHYEMVWEQGDQKLRQSDGVGGGHRSTAWCMAITNQVRGGVMVRFDAAALRQSSKLIPEGKRLQFVTERGLGLPGIYQAILGQDRDAFTRIQDAVRGHFPTVKTLRVTAISESELVIETELVDGTRVRPEFMSDGLLYYLGFAAIRHLAPVGVLLLEEPENGLHPARIRDVIKLMRQFVQSSGTQVLMATHSPLVVNELRADEVSVVTRDAKRGTQVQLIKDTPNFERRAKSAELGELWLSYADGVQEAALLQPKSAAS